VKVTPGATFSLRATRSSALDDFDITFYRKLTSCEADAVETALPHVNLDGNEYGIVPKDSKVAAITLNRGAPSGTFTYREGRLRGDPKPPKDIVIAVIDTGIRPTHEVFNYCRCGKTKFRSTRRDPDPRDQIAAWWDFSLEKPDGSQMTSPHEPEEGQVWDNRVKDPYDRFGHGTATASLAAGRNVSWRKDRSFAPGYKLAIAKVGDGNGDVTGDLDHALRWAVDTAHADVVSISIGALAPLPSALTGFYPELARARRSGVFVVVSNGNGWGNAGVPGEPGWATPYGNSTNVLSVGGSGQINPVPSTASYDTTDAEVVAKWLDVGVASHTGNHGYTLMAGTSFSAPVVAGMAARVKAFAEPVARKKHKRLSLSYIETLLKYSARDTNVPPNMEGYGVLDYNQIVGVALPNAVKLSLPKRPDPDPNRSYVEQVRHPVTDLWTNTLYF
jgi:subtilisin family serine protease